MKSSSLQDRIEQTSRHDGRATTVKRSFPQTDYHYQATPPASAAALTDSHPSLANYERELRTFREIGKPVLGSQFNWQFAVETVVLGLVGAAIAWSLVSMLIAFAVG
ncbi:MAG: hypothetical protein ABI217_06165 [Chthoniobacterales bacterium]